MYSREPTVARTKSSSREDESSTPQKLRSAYPPLDYRLRFLFPDNIGAALRQPEIWQRARKRAMCATGKTFRPRSILMTGCRREVDSNPRDSFGIRWAEFGTSLAHYSAIQRGSAL